MVTEHVLCRPRGKVLFQTQAILFARTLLTSSHVASTYIDIAAATTLHITYMKFNRALTNGSLLIKTLSLADSSCHLAAVRGCTSQSRGLEHQARTPRT